MYISVMDHFAAATSQLSFRSDHASIEEVETQRKEGRNEEQRLIFVFAERSRRRESEEER